MINAGALIHFEVHVYDLNNAERLSKTVTLSKFLYEDADVINLADKCIVVRRFACRNNDKVPIETGKFSDNLKVTENRLLEDGVAQSVEFDPRWGRNLPTSYVHFSMSRWSLIGLGCQYV